MESLHHLQQIFFLVPVAYECQSRIAKLVSESQKSFNQKISSAMPVEVADVQQIHLSRVLCGNRGCVNERLNWSVSHCRDSCRRDPQTYQPPALLFCYDKDMIDASNR